MVVARFGWFLVLVSTPNQNGTHQIVSPTSNPVWSLKPSNETKEPKVKGRKFSVVNILLSMRGRKNFRKGRNGMFLMTFFEHRTKDSSEKWY